MSVAAVICEFNPFHNGHKYLLSRAKSDNCAVICIMSGNFVQRGDFAICDKFIRAEAAVKNGADVVFELPLPYACAPAETFSRGAVSLLEKMNVVDKLYFGSESDLDDISVVLTLSEGEAFKVRLEALMKSGLSYPDAFFETAGKKSLTGGNDILALEYLRQLKKLQSDIVPVAIKRVGNEHNSDEVKGEYASASLLRDKMKNGENYENLSPMKLSDNEYSDFNKLEISVLSKLRQMNESDFYKIADMTEGLEYRFTKAVSDAASLYDLNEKIRTRRYTLSKIRRLILSSYLGVTKEMQEYIPSYVTVLAASEKGTKLISDIKKNSDILPVIRFSETEELSPDDRKLYDFTCLCDDIFGLSLKKIRPVGYDKTHLFRVIKSNN